MSGTPKTDKLVAKMLCHITRPDSVVMEVEVDAKANGEDCLNKVIHGTHSGLWVIYGIHTGLWVTYGIHTGIPQPDTPDWLCCGRWATKREHFWHFCKTLSS